MGTIDQARAGPAGFDKSGFLCPESGRIAPQSEGRTLHTRDYLVPRLPTLSKTQTQKTHISQEEETQIQNKNPSPWGCL